MGAEGEGEMILRTIVVLIALLVSSGAQANYFTYQQWLAMSELGRAAYVAGAFDSLLTFIDPADEQALAMKWHYNNCLLRAQMSDTQLAANVMNFAKDRPELHTGPVQGALIGYLIAACGAPPTK
jgi:hypothetical protein